RKQMTIKSILILGLCIISIAPFAQNLTFEHWQNESRQNKGLLPRYGDSKKSKEEIESDRAFEKKVMESFEHREDASNHMIDLGFQYLYRGDPRTAMYRFNQAYLLDRENPYIYWGYGAVYMFFERFDLARE